MEAEEAVRQVRGERALHATLRVVNPPQDVSLVSAGV